MKAIVRCVEDALLHDLIVDQLLNPIDQCCGKWLVVQTYFYFAQNQELVLANNLFTNALLSGQKRTIKKVAPHIPGATFFLFLW